MTITDSGVGGLVRVTLVFGEKRRDLALPSAVPVAEMLPELARSFGALDATNAHLGLVLVGSDGATLASSSGLAFQNVHDGAVLTLSPGTGETRRVYDDVVEAMADVVEETTTPWKPESARRTALISAAALLVIGAVALGLERTSVLAGAMAGVISLVLLTGSIVLARLDDQHEIALMLGWAASVFAGVGAYTGVSGSETLGVPVASAGAAVLVVAAVAAGGLTRDRLQMLPPMLVGGVAAASSGIVAGTDLGAAEVYLVALVVVVLAAGLQPVLALAAAGGSAPQPEDPNQLPDDPDEIHVDDVRAGARIGHDVLLAAVVTTGALVTLVAPLAVSLGLAGTLAVTCTAVVVLIRTRLFRAGQEVALGLFSGAAGLLSVAVSVVVLHASWRPALIIVLTVLAAGTLVATLVPSTGTVARGRRAEVLEVVALVALIPLTVIAIGVLSAVRS